MKLTAKQERFVSEYLIDLNTTHAAIRAGYSEKTAQEQSSRLLSNVMVRQAVFDAQSRVTEKAEWSAADRLHMLAGISVANIKMDGITLCVELGGLRDQCEHLRWLAEAQP